MYRVLNMSFKIIFIVCSVIITCDFFCDYILILITLFFICYHVFVFSTIFDYFMIGMLVQGKVFFTSAFYFFGFSVTKGISIVYLSVPFVTLQ
jgi:hypothetical protein